MKKSVRLLFLVLCVSVSSFAQDAFDIAEKQTGPIVPVTFGEPQYEAPTGGVLFDNGPLVNLPGGGFGGADASALQSALAMTIYGFGHQVTANNSMADDFVVPAEGWTINEMQFFSYQTGSTLTSTITEVRVQIWSGDPTAGGTIVWGDLTTNRMATTAFSNIYRSIDTAPTANNRPIMVQTCTIGVTLAAGTYWVQWMTNGTLASGPWAPPITIQGQTNTGNGKQNLAGVWGNALDTTFPQGLPFIVYGSVVPVELTSFTASVTENVVTLNWTTATEVNNSGFSVERKSAVSDFAQIGFAPGFGTTTEPKSYTFTDEGLQTGVYTYRLKQVDFDGTFEYSDPVEIEVIAPANFSLDQNYPNPFNPSTRINFSLAVDSKVSLKVFDLLGQEIVTLINQNLTAGVHQYDFDAVNINGGVYFYRIEATGVNGSEFTQVRKMVLLK